MLLYHGFCHVRRDDDPENLFVELSALEEQVAWLVREGWEPLTWQDWRAVHDLCRPRPRRSFLLTIDDGFVSTSEAIEVLARHDVPCVVYLPAGLLGRTATWLAQPAEAPLVTADEARALLSPLVDVGVHGWDHTSMLDRAPEELHRQTAGAYAALQDAVGQVVPSFAYPFGDHDEAARSAVREAGLDSAFSVFDDVGRRAISRVDVNATDTLASFRLKLMPGYRRAWRALDSMSFLRRVTRRLLTARGSAS